MRILILGGTVFLGRHVADAALARGHDLTLFNRGRTNPGLFPEAEKLRGDRDGDLAALDGRTFDAVVDTSGYVPRVVRETLEGLGDVGHYTFVSSISVYADMSQPPTESSPLGTLERETEEVDGETYGPLKALCEAAVRERLPDAFVVRPGLISGPWDPTGRFTYWPVRVADGGRVLAPAPPDAPAQIIDVRDLAEWIVDAAERRLAGTYNAVCEPFSFERLLETCTRVARSDAELVWIDPDFLAEHDVGEWMELPLWIRDPAFARMLEVDPSAALSNGLRIRPLDETVAATLAWARSDEAAAVEAKAGLEREKERVVLDRWLSKD
jgi:2'-hydroxyisoflavone reductase